MTTSEQHAPVPQSVLAEERRLAHAGTLARIAGALRAPPAACRLRMARDIHRADRPERRVPRPPHQRLQDPRVGHPEGDRPDRREVRRPEGRRAARRARGAERAAHRHAPLAPPRSGRCSARAARRRRTSPRIRRTCRRSRARSRSRASSRTTGRSRSTTSSSIARDSSCRASGIVSLEDQLRTIGQSGRHAGRVHGRGRKRAADPGPERHHRPARGLRDPDGAVPRARADGDPAAVRDRRGDRRRS